MPFMIDPRSGVPVFRQIIEQVKLHIAGGMLAPGDELPSIRTLSVPLGVNPMTISKAYNILVHDGVLERRPGRPLTVLPVTAEQMEVQRMEQLRDSLRSTVTVVSQLGIEADAAVKVFRELLEQEKAARDSDGKEDAS